MPELIDAPPAHNTIPRTRVRHAENRALAAELRANPGRWARYPYPLDRPRDLRYRIRAGKDNAFGPGFTAELRNGAVYIAYQPEQDNT